MASDNNEMEHKLHEEFENWLAETGSENIYLLESHHSNGGNGVKLTMLLASEYEFDLYCPKDYPSTVDTFSVTVSLSSLKSWAEQVNQFCNRKNNVQLREVLSEAEKLYSTHNKPTPMIVDDSDDPEDSTEESYKAQMSDDEEGIFTTDWDLQVARRKKRWLQKETEIRDKLKRSKSSHTTITGAGPSKAVEVLDPFKLQQIDPGSVFTGGGSSGVLTNDLIKIMQNENEIGLSCEPIDDNIYCWSVKFFAFEVDSELASDLHALKRLHGYDYIELQLDFVMDLYPFYPPMVKVIRPRLMGSLMQRVSHMEIMKLSFWNPTKEMMAVLKEVKCCLQQWARLDVECERNDRSKYVQGSYGSMDHHLLNLAFTSEINPRSNNQYLVEVDKSFTYSSQHKFLKSKDGKKKNEFWAAGVGYGHSRRPAWDVKAYLAAQKEKDKKVEATLGDILHTLRCLYSQHAPQLKPVRIQPVVSQSKIKASETSRACGEGSSINLNLLQSNHVATNSNDVNHMDTDEQPSLSQAMDNGTAEPKSIPCKPAKVADVVDPIDDMFVVLEGSAIIPFLEQNLRVDSFLEICRHTAVYKAIVDIIREIALQNQLVPLLGPLPQQEKSLYELLQVLADKADKLLQHICKAGNGHVPKANDADDDGTRSNSSLFQTHKKKNWFTKSKDGKDAIVPAPPAAAAAASTSQPMGSPTPGPSKDPPQPGTSTVDEPSMATSEEKLAREFQVLFRDVTEGFKRANIDPQRRVLTAPDSKTPLICTCGAIDENLLMLWQDSVLEEAYRTALSPIQIDSCDIPLSGSFAHHYSKDFQKQCALTQSQVFRVAQEITSLSTSLPLSMSSSVFIRTDDEKLTLMKVLISGPEGTPYSGGCFIFDIFFPSGYPRSPPKVFLCTTGHNSVRFNPNLYSCGKVCLSLLGTWEGQTGEQWHETTSTLLQVLISIQSLILVPEPYFNEPGYEREIGTDPGIKHSTEYNAEVRFNTIKHAMIAQMLKPCPEFEHVIRTHFHVKKDRILQELQSCQATKMKKLDKCLIQLKEAFKRNSQLLEKMTGAANDAAEQNNTTPEQSNTVSPSSSEGNDKSSGLSSKRSSPGPQPSTSKADLESMDEDEGTDEIHCVRCGGLIPQEGTSGAAMSNDAAKEESFELTTALTSGPDGDLLAQGHMVSEEDGPSDEDDEEDKVQASALCFGL